MSTSSEIESRLEGEIAQIKTDFQSLTLDKNAKCNLIELLTVDKQFIAILEHTRLILITMGNYCTDVQGEVISAYLRDLNVLIELANHINLSSILSDESLHRSNLIRPDSTTSIVQEEPPSGTREQLASGASSPASEHTQFSTDEQDSTETPEREKTNLSTLVEQLSEKYHSEEIVLYFQLLIKLENQKNQLIEIDLDLQRKHSDYLSNTSEDRTSKIPRKIQLDREILLPDDPIGVGAKDTETKTFDAVVSAPWQRIDRVRMPLDELYKSNPSPQLQNIIQHLKQFAFSANKAVAALIGKNMAEQHIHEINRNLATSLKRKISKTSDAIKKQQFMSRQMLSLLHTATLGGEENHIDAYIQETLKTVWPEYDPLESSTNSLIPEALGMREQNPIDYAIMGSQINCAKFNLTKLASLHETHGKSTIWLILQLAKPTTKPVEVKQQIEACIEIASQIRNDVLGKHDSLNAMMHIRDIAYQLVLKDATSLARVTEIFDTPNNDSPEAVGSWLYEKLSEREQASLQLHIKKISYTIARQKLADNLAVQREMALNAEKASLTLEIHQLKDEHHQQLERVETARREALKAQAALLAQENPTDELCLLLKRIERDTQKIEEKECALKKQEELLKRLTSNNQESKIKNNQSMIKTLRKKQERYLSFLKVINDPASESNLSQFELVRFKKLTSEQKAAYQNTNFAQKIQDRIDNLEMENEDLSRALAYIETTQQQIPLERVQLDTLRDVSLPESYEQLSQAVHKKIELLNQQVIDLTEQMRLFDAGFIELNTTLTENERQLAQAQETISAQKIQQEKLETELADNQKQIQRTEQELEHQTAQLDDAQTTIREKDSTMLQLQEELLSLKSAQQSLQEELKKSSRIISAQKMHISELKKDLQKSQVQLEQTNTENIQLHTTINELQIKIDLQTRQISEKEQSIQEQNQTLQELQNEISSQTAQLSEYTDALTKARATISEQTVKAEQAQTRQDAMQLEITTLQKKLLSQKDALHNALEVNSQLMQQQAQQQNIQMELIEQQSLNQRMQIENNAFRVLLEEATADNQTKGHDIAQLQETVTQQQETLQSEQILREQQQVDIQEKYRQIESLQAKLSASNARLNPLEQISPSTDVSSPRASTSDTEEHEVMMSIRSQQNIMATSTRNESPSSPVGEPENDHVSPELVRPEQQDHRKDEVELLHNSLPLVDPFDLFENQMKLYRQRPNFNQEFNKASLHLMAELKTLPQTTERDRLVSLCTTVIPNGSNQEVVKTNTQEIGTLCHHLHLLGNTSPKMKKLAQALAIFACAALVVVGVLAAIPSGGTSLLLTAIGTIGLTTTTAATVGIATVTTTGVTSMGLFAASNASENAKIGARYQESLLKLSNDPDVDRRPKK